MSLIILPNQLFAKKYIPKDIHTIILYEHPAFFTKYKFNKLKLLLHRVSMKKYAEVMVQYFTVKYFNFNENPVYPINNVYHFFQPNNIKIPGEVIKTPNFLCIDLFKKYRDKTDKFVFNNFYLWMKKNLDIIPDVKSKDKYNRNKIPTSEIKYIPKDSVFTIDILKNSIRYINIHFKNNYGPDLNETLIYFPFTHAQANKLLTEFIQYKIKDFGKYQDALIFNDLNTVNNQNISLYHSFLSSSVNIGLLQPIDIINKLLDVSQSYKKVNINSLEAFIRQLFWRDYQLYCYTYMSLNKCTFNNKLKLNKKWFEGSTGIYPVDITIKKAFAFGYLHHIERLMVMGNFMLLYGISPKETYKWFMIFSIDSYEWVMYQNVYDMIYGMGNGMRRFYISSSNYILKMSNIKKDTWCQVWDDLFHKFLKKNKNKIGYPYE